jgi:MFS family permease
MSRTSVLLAIAIVSLIQIPALAIFAAISDRTGRRKIYLAGAILTAVFGSNVPISLAFTGVSLLAVGCVLALSETYQHDLDDAEQAVAPR